MPNPKISIATVTFNCRDVIEESLLSIVNQTYHNREYIIIDGGSTDGTLELLNQYKDRIDILVSEPDRGIYDAMNKALRRATGDFLIFMGADDHFMSWHTLERVAPKLEDQHHVYYGNVYFEGYNLIHKGKFNKVKRAIFNYCHQSIFYPKAAYKSYGYDLKYPLYADDEYNFRVSEKFPFTYIGNTVSFYAQGGASATREDANWERDKRSVIIRHCGIFAYAMREIRNLIKTGKF